MSADRKVTALARQWPACAALTMAWCERSEEMIGGPIPDGVRLLRRVIDSGLPGYALTNMEAETYPLRRIRYDFLGLLERFSLDPASTLFVDDSRVNVAGAARAGMDAVLYTVPGPVLSRLGLAAE